MFVISFGGKLKNGDFNQYLRNMDPTFNFVKFEAKICVDIFIVMHYIAVQLLKHLKLINDIYLKVKYRRQT